MTDIDSMSGAELDALVATDFVGWRLAMQPAIGDRLAGVWLDAAGGFAAAGDWTPSADWVDISHVLLKALGEGLSVTIFLNGDPTPVLYTVHIPDAPGHIGHDVIAEAPTLPIALVRVICKAVKHD